MGERTRLTDPKPAVFLDRDGVVIESAVKDGVPHPPASVGDVRFVPGVTEALDRLRQAGFALIVVTNQPDVARKTQRRDVVEAINARLAQSLPIDAFYVCYHDDRDECQCRKPLPGLLLEAARDRRLALEASYLIGDRWRDVDAANRAGVAAVFIDYGYEETLRSSPAARVASLSEAVAWILSHPLSTTLRRD